MSKLRTTRFGFEWNDVAVLRAYEHKGHIGIMIESGRQRITVRVTPTGLIRVDEPAIIHDGTRVSGDE